jgi:hypothetical protein
LIHDTAWIRCIFDRNLLALGHMYLRESKHRRADGSTVSCLQLAENVWSPERRRSETHVVCNCGRADDPAVVERLRKLAASILRRCSPEEIVGASQGDLRLVCTWPNGEVFHQPRWHLSPA